MTTGTMLGHIEVIHADSEGNILGYQQTDNIIVNDGKNCTAMLLFGGTTHNLPGGEGCRAATASGLGNYNVIGVGNGTALPGGNKILELTNEIDGLNGIVRTVGTLGAYTNSTGDSGTATQRITAQFTWLGNSADVNQAGLFNQTTINAASSTFALKDFPSTVSMNTDD